MATVAMSIHSLRSKLSITALLLGSRSGRGLPESLCPAMSSGGESVGLTTEHGINKLDPNRPTPQRPVRRLLNSPTTWRADLWNNRARRLGTPALQTGGPR